MGAEGRGSGRSISAFDLHSGLSECAGSLVRYGGHRAAAGVTVSRDRVGEFAARFNAVARDRLRPADLVPEVHVDLEVSIDDVTPELEGYRSISSPAESAIPRLRSSLAVCIRHRRVRVSHDGLKMRLARDWVPPRRVAWGAAHRLSELGGGRSGRRRLSRGAG